MSEKAKCPNSECRGGIVNNYTVDNPSAIAHCPVCHGTGFAPAGDKPRANGLVTHPIESDEPVLPTGEGLLTDDEMMRLNGSSLGNWAKGNYLDSLRVIRDAQAALTAGQMIEELKLYDALPKKKLSEIIMILESGLKSRYGGKPE